MKQGKDRPEGCEPEYSVSRRDFLKTSSVALGAFACAAPASAGIHLAEKSLIHIYLPGGPSHLDTFDLKPGAAKDLRGEFRPIRTNALGVEICELFPRLARMADRFTIVRGITGLVDEHSPSPCDSGWPADSFRKAGGRPGIAAVLSTVPTSAAYPVSVDLTGWTSAGYLEDQALIFEPATLREQRATKRRFKRSSKTANVQKNTKIPELAPRATAFASGSPREPISFPSKELDFYRESDATLKRYGIAQRAENARLLQARRLVEAGVRCVALEWGYWDTHGNNFGQLRNQLPALDQALSALIEDLHARGRLDDTLILMSGEFGRTPEINNGAGRDHWPETSCAFLAGGSLPHGRVIGRTDHQGRFPQDPVPMQAVTAAAYAGLGMDAARIRLTDSAGRRHALFHRSVQSSRLC